MWMLRAMMWMLKRYAVDVKSCDLDVKGLWDVDAQDHGSDQLDWHHPDGIWPFGNQCLLDSVRAHLYSALLGTKRACVSKSRSRITSSL